MKTIRTFFFTAVSCFVTTLTWNVPGLAGADTTETAGLDKASIVAHRGASATAPENTLASAREALAAGAGAVECDVRLSKDGVPVLFNDPTVRRIGGGDVNLGDLTLEEIRKLDAGAWKDEKFRGEKIPTLEEFLLLLKASDGEAIIELKIGGIEENVLEIVRKTGMLERSSFISFSAGVVKRMRELAPDRTTAWLYGEDLKDKGTPEQNADRLAETLLAKCREMNTETLDLAQQILSKRLVEKLKAEGIRVWCYTVDDTWRMNTLLDWGVEKITTNHPGRMTHTLAVRQRIARAMDGNAKPAPGMPVSVRRNVAHRGASDVAPENTIPAYRQAIADGADGAECDVYESTDGVLFLTHDHTTKRTLGGGEDKVWELPYTEIRKRDAGAWKGEKFRGTHAPTLEEYLHVLKGGPCHPVIEIKRDGFEHKVVDAIRKAGMIDVSTVIAFSPEVVREIRRLEPRLSVAWLYGEKMSGKNPDEEAERLYELLLWRCHELDTSILDLQHDILSETLVKKLKEAGLHVWCWTVNDESRMNTLLDWGVESITTDRPGLLHGVLESRK